MTWLEHRIPPPVIAAATAAAMWGIATVTPSVALDRTLQLVTVGALAATGIAIMLAAVVAFYRAKTTINPIDIDKASSLVTGGVFALSRNPMYLAVVLILVAFAVHLSSPAAILGPMAFALIVTRLQIMPEERVLAAKFGDAFAAYARRTRRWI